MDFLDPKKQRSHSIRLTVGYVLIAVAILLATGILLRIAYGFGLDKNGDVVQNGFAFVSSQPGGAKIFVNNKLTDTTGARLQLPEGEYDISIQKDGYRSWNRHVMVPGGGVVRYDYPLLVPTDLITKPLQDYSSLPGFASESPDRHWLLVSKPASPLHFDVYDLSDHTAVGSSATEIAVPASIATAASGAESWKLDEWSTDNRHVILEHHYGSSMEYILLDRQDPAKSVNLTKTFNLKPGQQVMLHDKKYDQYYLFDPANKKVDEVSLSDPATVTPVLSNALAFKPYGSDMFLYATENEAAPGRALVMLRHGDVTYKIRDVAAGGTYLIDMAQYDGDWYVAVGSSAENKVYVFKNPESVRKAGKLKNLVPVRILEVTAPNYLEFSNNTRFIMTENGSDFAVFDAETDKDYKYTAKQPLDAPQPHAIWMDGDRITYVSGGHIVFFDYDGTNPQTLEADDPHVLPVFDRDYKYIYALEPPTAATGQSIFTQTSLLIPKDQ